ncbi:MAG: hydrogenase iron-sulfur subunit [Pseudomonadota bacterium]
MDHVLNKIIVLPPPAVLAGWGIDPNRLTSELGRAAEVVTVSSWDQAANLAPPENSGVVLVGRAEPLPALKALQTTIDLASWTPWMAGPPHEKALALITAALAEVSLGRKATFRRIVPEKKVLVWGRGPAAEKTTAALLGAGLEVILLGGAPDFSPEPAWSGRFTSLPQARFQGLKGFPGRFTVFLSSDDGSRELSVGAVVLCGVDAGSTRDPAAGPGGAGRPGFKLAFTAGLEQAATSGDMGRIMTAAAAAARETDNAVFILAPHVKVAGPGLERLYTAAREAGVVFLRTPDGGPRTATTPDGRTEFRFFDGAARADIRLAPDFLVPDEPRKPDSTLSEAAGLMNLTLGEDGYLAPDNTLFLPAATNRRGILALGPARGTFSADVLDREIGSAAGEIGRLLTPVEIQDNRLVNDPGRCAICLTCVRTCPVGALDYVERPVADPLACVECGLCAAECPGDALQLEGFTDPQIKARLRILLERPRTKDDFIPRLVLFGCRRSAFPALAAAPTPETPVDLVPIPLPCAGKIEQDLVFSAFLQGADGVMVVSCHHDNCRTHQGSRDAARRGRHLKMLLEKAGFEPARLSFFTLAPNMGVEFQRATVEFKDRIKELGPSPLSGGGS